MAQVAPGGVAALTWPIGSPPRSKPASRYDVIRWDYFNETHIFLDKESSVVKCLVGVEKQEVEVIYWYLTGFFLFYQRKRIECN